MRQTGFDNEAYLKAQAEGLTKRAEAFGNKLYLEFGGKLMFDYHAARVLPGYDPNAKLRLLRALGDKAEIILCVYAEDIERKKMRADFGISYDDDALKLIDSLRAWGIHVCAVVITRFDGQPAALQFRNKLEARGIAVKLHRAVPGYPSNLDLVVSPEGYGANAYVETTRPIVVVTGPGPGSGKLATCLTMLYHDRMAGRPAGYAKFETFPVWDLPLKHPVNLAYEAATADLGDINMIDPFHLEAYGKVAVNYNRDVDAFPLLREIWTRLDRGGECPYKSPTDMGVNRISAGIVDDAVCQEAARQEVIRRYFRHLSDAVAKGSSDKRPVEILERLMRQLRLSPEDRAVVVPARQAAHDASLTHALEGVACGAALELPDGEIVRGKAEKGLQLVGNAPCLFHGKTEHAAGAFVDGDGNTYRAAEGRNSLALAEYRSGTGKTVAVHGFLIAEHPADDVVMDGKLAALLPVEQQRRIFAFHNIGGTSLHTGGKGGISKARGFQKHGKHHAEIALPSGIVVAKFDHVFQRMDIVPGFAGFRLPLHPLHLREHVRKHGDKLLLFRGKGMALAAVDAENAAIGQRAAQEGTDFRFPVFLIIAEICLILVDGPHHDGRTVAQNPPRKALAGINHGVLIDMVALTVGGHDLSALPGTGGFKQHHGIGLEHAGGQCKNGFNRIFDDHGTNKVNRKRGISG